MKLLLTSAGVTNPSIRAALDELLPRPLAECTAMCIPTAMHGHPHAPPQYTWEFVAGRSTNPMTELGWRSVGLLELAALPSIERERWEGWVRETDVLLVSGGCAAYLTHWMRGSGLADLLPELEDKVWVGLSAGSMVMTPRIGADFVAWPGAEGRDEALGVVGFSLFPHLVEPGRPGNTIEEAREWHASLGGLPAYAVDDDTAIRVMDGRVDVVSEGRWEQLGG